MKKLNNWVPHELTENPKNVILKYILLFCATITNHLSMELWRATKSGFYMTTGDGQLSGWRNSKALPKAKLSPKKRSWSLFDGLLPTWSTRAFWILVKPLHLRNTLSKLMRCTENCNACSWHWSTERARFFSTTMPNCTLHKQRFKC